MPYFVIRAESDVYKQDPKIGLIQETDDLDGLNKIINLKSEDIIKNAV